jgi:superfamily II DNA/RNA helicase
MLTERCLCPKLESLSYTISVESGALDAWIGLIVARRLRLRGEKVAYLQKLTLSVPSRLDAEVILGQLKSRGIDVEGVRMVINRD